MSSVDQQQKQVFGNFVGVSVEELERMQLAEKPSLVASVGGYPYGALTSEIVPHTNPDAVGTPVSTAEEAHSDSMP